MPRPVSIRASYRDDASYLLRLETAVSKDVRQSRTWRVGTTRAARKLALRLLEADSRMNMGPMAAELLGRERGRKKRRAGRAAPRAGAAT